MQSKKLDAPGLKRRRNRDGTTRLYWCARIDLTKKGYEPETVRLPYDEGDPLCHPLIEAACQRYQAEMLEWASGHRRERYGYDGTIRGLVRRYQADEASPYKQLKHNTARTYGELMDKIERAFGARALSALCITDFRRWYDVAKKPKKNGGPERVAKAYNIMRMLRRLFSYGVMAELAECERLNKVIAQARFKQPARNRNKLTLEHVRAFIAKAMEAGRPSLALATAIQFETAMRQRDVIGEWLPVPNGEKPNGIVLNNRRWANGLTWSDLANDLVISKETTKTGAMVAADLKDYPLVLDLLGRWTGNRVGPLIIDEMEGRPYAEHAFAREWRTVARAAGIPDYIKNMQARAGAITEAEDAGAELDEIRGAVGHTDAKTTARYSRGAAGKAKAVASKRVAHRTAKEQK